MPLCFGRLWISGFVQPVATDDATTASSDTIE